MADVSKIKLPNGTTYDIKDTTSGYTKNTGTITKIQTTAGAHTTINVSSGAATFNVPTKTSHLTNDSGFLTSHQTLYEANLNWGGKDFSSGYSPIDAAMIDVLGANRFAFLKAAGLTIEYSTNGGSSYTDYGATDAQKVGLFSSGQSFYLGKHTSNGSCTTNDRLRVTIDTGAANIYTVLNKIAIYMSTSGATVQVLIEKALQSSPTTFSTHKDWTGISGWSGWNILNISELTTYGNTASSQYGRIRFTFRQTAVNTNYTSANISKIMGFGGVGWATPSTMAATGHLYSYDSSQNATFPAKVTANGGFSGNLTGNVTGNVSGSAGSVAWTGVTGKPSSTGSSTTGISIAAHGTGTVIGVQSTTTTASKVTVGSSSTDYGVKSAGSASTWTFEEKTIPNVTSAGTASSWTFEEKTIPNVTAAGSGSASLTFTMDTTDTKKLKITFSHTHTAPTIGTAIKVQSKSGGSNGTAPTLGTAIKVQSKSGGANSTAPTLGSKVPTVSASDVTVPIKNTSASTFVTGTTHTVTDNGHTHTI